MSASAPALCSLPAMRTVRPARLLARAGGEAGADLDLVLARHHPGRDGEAAGAVFAAKLVIGASAQAMARAEQRDRFEQIGLARAVVADSTTGRASSSSSARA